MVREGSPTSGETGNRKAINLGPGLGPPDESTTGLEVGEAAPKSLRERMNEGRRSSPEVRALPDKSFKALPEGRDLFALRMAADGLPARLDQIHGRFGFTDNVRPKEIAEICLALTVLIDALEDCLGDVGQAQIAFGENLQKEITSLREQVTALEGREDLQSTAFDEIAQAVLIVTISVGIGAVIGGPTLAYLQHATLSSKLAEGAISGGAGGIASEVVRLINHPAR